MNVERVRNDYIDLHYVVPATYLDGLMTDEAKLTEIYSEAMFIIDSWN